LPSGVSLTLTTDTRFQTSPSPLKLALGGVCLVAVLGVFVLLGRAARGGGRLGGWGGGGRRRRLHRRDRAQPRQQRVRRQRLPVAERAGGPVQLDLRAVRPVVGGVF